MQNKIETPGLKVVQSNYDYHNERFLCRCQARPNASLHDEYVSLQELRTYCAHKSEFLNLIDEGITLEEWMQQMKPTGINATMTQVLRHRMN